MIKINMKMVSLVTVMMSQIFCFQTATAERENQYSSTPNSGIPKLVLDEWLLHELECNLSSPGINRSKAASEILNFTQEFQAFYVTNFSHFNLEELQRYSYTINKQLDFLKKFPTFAKTVLPNISHFQDVLFMENAFDIFSILEMKRLILLEKVYDHVTDLAFSSELESVSSQFASLLLGFRKHIESETKSLRKFMRYIMEGRPDNKHIPSRYMEGSLPGLDQLLKTLNVSSSIQVMNDDVYQIEPSTNDSLCLIREFDEEAKIDCLKVQHRRKGSRKCLTFRFIQKSDEDYVIQTMEGDRKTLKIRPEPYSDVILSNVFMLYLLRFGYVVRRGFMSVWSVLHKMIRIYKVDQLSQFRLVKLSNGNFFIVCRLTSRNIYLTRSRNTDKVYGNSTSCFTNVNDLHQWHISSDVP